MPAQLIVGHVQEKIHLQFQHLIVSYKQAINTSQRIYSQITGRE